MKIVDVNVNDSETSVEIDLFEGRKLPEAVKRRIQEDVGNYLVEQSLVSMDRRKSPVQGEGTFKALSPKYKKKKLEEVGSSEPNLEFDGVMKDELDFRPSKIGITLGVFGERAPAADGHNNLSGKSQLPTRKFLPDVGQNYKQQYQREVQRIVADAIAEEITWKPSQFKDIVTRAELYAALIDIFGPLSRQELKLALYRNEDLLQIFMDLDLVRLL